MPQRLLLLLCIGLLLAVSVTVVTAQDPGGSDDCRDAAGGSIPCPEDDPDDDADTSSEPSQAGNPGDRDGDGTNDGQDRCPDAGGDAALGGCPDFDGDNTPDIDDRCPDVGGPDTNAGCPQDLTAPESTLSPDPTASAGGAADLSAPLPAEGPCVVATLRNQAINVRLFPSEIAPVVDLLAPGNTYAVSEIWVSLTGTWYRIQDPSGWVAGSVVLSGGDCAQAPHVFEMPGQLAASPDGPPEECPINARCVAPFVLDLASAEPFGTDVETFCAESGLCIGTFGAPLPEPDDCTANALCCDPFTSCFDLLVWNAPADPGMPESIDVTLLRVVLPPPGPDPMPEPEPLWLGTFPADPVAQTREHILLARQVGVPFEEDGVEETFPMLDLILDDGGGEPIAMLLPAVQKVRAAAARMMVADLDMLLIVFTGEHEPVSPEEEAELPFTVEETEEETAAKQFGKECTGNASVQVCSYFAFGRRVATCMYKEDSTLCL